MAVEINKLSWIIGGEAGYGIMTAGENFARAMTLGGLSIHSHVEYPSLIRGGHNSFGVRVEEENVTCPIKLYNIVAALNKDTVDRHKEFLTVGGGIIYDSSQIKISEGDIRKDVRLYDVPLMSLTREVPDANRVMRNSALVGASIALVNYNFELLAEAIRGVHNKNKKGSAMAEINVKVAKKGYDYVKKMFPDDFQVQLTKKTRKKVMLMKGNEALALGAIKAGCKFLSAYPMTPATGIMNYFTQKEESMNIVMKQADDEIAAINMALGASFAGVRSMTSTSGGGLALMSETTSLVGISEVPLVIVNVQRPGPATGLPTRQGQGDLKFTLNVGHGEFPRILIAPGDIEDCFYETFNAFNLADKYQLPVFILSDKHLAASYRSVKEFDTKNMKIDRGWLLTDAESNKWADYKRFMVTDSGISPRTIPGQKTVFTSSSDEHNEYGQICEKPDNRNMMEDKRWRKLDTAMQDIPLPKLYGPEKADITLVGWGSTKGAILEAIKYLKKDGITANFLHFVYIFPFHTNHVHRILNESKFIINIEENKGAQMAGVIREHTGFKIEHNILKYSGRTFYPSEIYDEIKRVYNG